VVTPTTGLNELSSALVAALQLEHAAGPRPADRDRGVHRAAIPFRRRSGAELHARWPSSGWSARRSTAAIRGAVRVGNRRRRELADNDAARFLDNPGSCSPSKVTPRLARAPMSTPCGDYPPRC